VEIEVDDEPTAARLAYVANSVGQSDIPRLATLRWRVDGAGPWTLFEQGDRVTTFHRFDDLLFVLYQRSYGRLNEHLALGGWLGLHGGLVTIDGRRVVLVGAKGAGKTTLMLHLLTDGWAVEGDEMVLARDGLAVALPRRFHVKPGTADLVAGLSDALDASPRTSLSDGTAIVGLDPADLGRPMATRPGPVDAAVILTANHAGAAGAEAISTVDLVAGVIDHVHPGSDSRPALFAALAALLGQAQGLRLDVGPLDDSVAALRAALAA
jgi:hypothetical protein